ncbi:MAG: hypothetical protein MUF25_11470, partial [Pirellulaceae bacterium]|nr:hypothetical protein [Pirellulaceae bacterium]
MTTQFRWLRRSLAVLGSLGAMAVVAVAVNERQPGQASLGAESSGGPASAAPAGATSAAERTVAVTTVPIALREVQRSVGAVGTFFGFDEVTVTAEASGRVVQVFHEVGQIV